MFLKSITNLLKQNPKINCYSELITIIHSSSGLNVIFFPNKIIFQKDGKYTEIKYDDLLKLAVSASEDNITINFSESSFSYKVQKESLKDEVLFLQSLKEAFPNGIEDSPSYMQDESKLFLNNTETSSSFSYLCKMMDENPHIVKSLLNKLNFGRQK